MAVAGLNNVTVLEPSYLGENYPPASRRWGNQERPITRTSYIRKLWRDLEGENRFREIERQQTSCNAHGNVRSQCSCSSPRTESEDASFTTSELENECPRDQNQMELQNGVEDNNINSCAQRSPALCLADKQRVRQIFREWGDKNSSGHGHGNGHGHTSHKNNCSRVQGTCEDECKRVKIVRQWIESNNREADSSGSIRRLYGRQALLDLLTRFRRERKLEIQNLSENRPVSTFAHRNRIQSLLRGRFLWNQRSVQEEKSTSNAANELGLLRQTKTVSDLRKGFLSKLVNYSQIHDGPQYDTASEESEDTLDSHQENTINQIDTINTLTDVSQSHKVDSETDTCEIESPREIGESLKQVLDIVSQNDVGQSHEVEPEQVLDIVNVNVNDVSQSNGVDAETDEGGQQLALTEASVECQEPIVEDNGNEWHNLSRSESNNELDLNSVENEDEWYQESNDGWYENGDVDNAENWYPVPEDSPVVRREPVFYDSDNENGNRFELQELMNRRSVSSLLGSDFRGRLDRVLSSYLERQDQDNENVDGDEDEDEDDDDVIEAVEGEQENDWRMMDGLRVEMVNLQERMNSMQKTLETCMSMQLELQRTVSQEVTWALKQRSCFLCCDGGFDTSPDRCGHVYICAKCAERVDWSKVKESVTVREAPVS